MGKKTINKEDKNNMSRGKLQTKQKSISASSLTSSDSRTFNMFSLIEFFQELSDELLRLVGISSQISKPTREKAFLCFV